jgi:hypothetical protein
MNTDNAKVQRVLELCRKSTDGTVPVGAIYAAIYIDDRPITAADEEVGKRIAAHLQGVAIRGQFDE